jgi:aryl-alcohol dehydrogenase-like predicted oxidoreductase
MTMQYREIGKTGIKISNMGIGSWAIGDSYWGQTDDQDSIKAIHQGLDAGLNFIDTAQLYGNGKSEELVGKAIQGKRSEIVLSTKVWKTHMKYDDVFKACEDSLQRLQTDYLDIYFIHYPPDSCPAEETMRAMLKLKEQGKIRVIGLSNFSVQQMEAVLQVGRFDVIQPCHSLFWRFMEREELPFCLANDIGVVTYSPLAQGLLTGKYNKGMVLPENDGRSKAPLFIGENYQRAVEAAEQLKPIADKYGKTVGQLAIAWAISMPGVTAAIVGAKNERQMQQNIGGTSYSLEEDDLKKIDVIGRTVTDFLPNYKSFFYSEIKE